MEQLSVSLQEQKNLTIEQAKAMLASCVAGAGLPDGRQAGNLRNIAWASAGQGLWTTFTDQYGGNAEADFIHSIGDDKKRWVKQFASAGDFKRAEEIAETICEEYARAQAQFQLAYSAAKAGDVERAERYAGVLTKPGVRQTIIDTTFSTLAATGNWERADDLANRAKLGTGAILSGAGEAAKQGNFDRFVALANRGAKQSPKMRERYDPDQVDWLEDITKTAAEVAFVQGSYGFIAGLRDAIEWPKDAEADVERWINSGVLNGIYESEDYAAGINLFAAKAIEKGSDPEAYTILQDALDERHWDLIEIIAPRLNSETLGLLHRLAHKEDHVDAAKVIGDARLRKDSSDNNYIVISDDTASIIIEEATKGNWDQALDLRHSIARMWAYDNMEQVIQLAVRQERFDLLPVLTEKNEALLKFAVGVMDSRAAFDESDRLVAEWLNENEGVIDEKEVVYFNLELLNHRAPTAAYFGDWQRASRSLQEMDDIAKKTGRPYGHRGYEFVAIEALKILKAVKPKQA